MRWKIIVVNATIVALVALLSYVLLATSLRGVLADSRERQRAVEQALRAADAQLALDALRLERWLDANAASDSVRGVFSAGIPAARNEAATAVANRLRDAAVGEPLFARMAPSLVAFVDAQGVGLGRNGSALLRGDRLADAYPSLAAALKTGQTGSAIWINRQRQEQLLASFVPLRDESGVVIGALIIGTPLNDERLSRTSELTSGNALIYELVADKQFEVLAQGGGTTQALVSAAVGPSVTAAARAALASRNVVKADAELEGHVFGALPLGGYGEQNGVLIAAVPASMVDSMGSLLWPVLAVGVLGLVLVGIGGVLLGNYVSQPVSELEDGLLAIINGNSALRFQIEHDELGGLVFRINSLLNALMGVPEDTTDDEGRPSTAPSARGFQDELNVDESTLDGPVDPVLAAKLAQEPDERYYRRLFDEYLAAKRKVGEPVEQIMAEAFTERVKATAKEVSQKHGRTLRFRVDVRGEAVLLVAVPLA